MLIGARTGAWKASGGGAPTALDYLGARAASAGQSSPLVDIIDYNENAGFGVFNDSLTNWTSLLSNDLRVTPWSALSAPYFHDDSYWVNGRANIAFSSYSKVSFAGAFTVELCGQSAQGAAGLMNKANDTLVSVGIFGIQSGWVRVPSTFGSIYSDLFSVNHTLRFVCTNGIVKFGHCHPIGRCL